MRFRVETFQRAIGLRGDHQQMPGTRRVSFFIDRRLCEDHVRIRAAEPQGSNARAARAATLLPGRQCRIHEERSVQGCTRD